MNAIRRALILTRLHFKHMVKELESLSKQKNTEGKIRCGHPPKHHALENPHRHERLLRAGAAHDTDVRGMVP